MRLATGAVGRKAGGAAHVLGGDLAGQQAVKGYVPGEIGFMNTVSEKGKRRTLLALVLLAGLVAHGQAPGPGAAGGMSGVMLKLLGNIDAFTARAEVQVLDGAQKEVVNRSMEVCLLDKKIRITTDLSENKDTPPAIAAGLKKWGLARVVTLIRPDKHLVYMIYPDRKALMSTAWEEGVATIGKKTAQGQEVVDGHPCVKNQVVITGEGGESTEATIWAATDLQDFPIQIRTQEKENGSWVRFKQVQLTKPDASQFEPPTGYAEFKDEQELKQGILKKMAEGGERK